MLHVSLTDACGQCLLQYASMVSIMSNIAAAGWHVAAILEALPQFAATHCFSLGATSIFRAAPFSLPPKDNPTSRAISQGVEHEVAEGQRQQQLSLSQSTSAQQQQQQLHQQDQGQLAQLSVQCAMQMIAGQGLGVVSDAAVGAAHFLAEQLKRLLQVSPASEGPQREPFRVDVRNDVRMHACLDHNDLPACYIPVERLLSPHGTCMNDAAIHLVSCALLHTVVCFHKISGMSLNTCCMSCAGVAAPSGGRPAAC